MEHRINILFYLRKSKKTREGLVPLYIRITVNGQRLDHSIQRYIEPTQWSAAAGQVKGSNDQARQVNLYLDTLNSKVLRLEREMVLDGLNVNFANFREKWLGLTERPRMLLEIFQQTMIKWAPWSKPVRISCWPRSTATTPPATISELFCIGSTELSISTSKS